MKAHRAAKISVGPISIEECFKLTALLGELVESMKPRNALYVPPKFYGLLSDTPGEPIEEAGLSARAASIELKAAHERLEADPAYRKLRRNGSFKRFQKIYTRKQDKSPRKARSLDWELSFLRSALGIAKMCCLREAVRNSKVTSPSHATTRKLGLEAYAETREQAERAAKVLAKSLDRGIGLQNPLKTFELRALLAELQAELKGVQRKRRETPKTIHTDTLDQMAVEVSRRFDVSSPSMLRAFAELLGIEVEHTTIAKISSSAHKRTRLRYS